MQAMIDRYGWQPILEGDNIIALKRPAGESTGITGNISLEPGGQFELSGAPLETLNETAAETEKHLNEVLDVGETRISPQGVRTLRESLPDCDIRD